MYRECTTVVQKRHTSTLNTYALMHSLTHAYAHTHIRTYTKSGPNRLGFDPLADANG